jgi:hypothetical protein
VKSRPILFSAPLVRALLEGRKTQTRRLIKWKPIAPGWNLTASAMEAGYYHTGIPTSGWVLRSRGHGGCWNDRTHPLHCPYGVVGDRLRVREAWAVDDSLDMVIPYQLEFGGRRPVRIHWMADGPKPDVFGRTRPGIFLPREASRITLEITNVRVQRLQDISGSDAHAEGVDLNSPPPDGKGWPQSNIECYARLWDHINGAGSWDANPWVWALTFRRI